MKAQVGDEEPVLVLVLVLVPVAVPALVLAPLR